MCRLSQRWPPSVAAAVLLAVAASPAAAQSSVPPPVAETVVVTGGALPIAFRELPRTVRVVTRDEIANLPVGTVTDLIRLVASADVRARGPRGIQADFSVRGAGFGQVLVLVDGVRVNNAQTGHHNSDLPVTLDDIERVEILLGPGSSAFGADAFGGTVNLITRRRTDRPSLSAAIGQYGLADIGASGGFSAGRIGQRVSGRVSRADGFEFDRDFQTVTLSSATQFGRRTRISTGFVDKAFGANGFYGPSPSKEWTRLWSASGEHQLVSRDGLDLRVRSSYRAHRDRFLWDVRRPGLFQNTHRTHAADASARLRWRATPALEVGVGAEVAGDWIRSSNLGRHRLARGASAVDLQWSAGAATAFQAAVRADWYSTFGSAVSPSLGVSRWVAPAWRIRASAGRAFRVPTFTERFYRDPAHEASSHLGPERAWAGDAGVDWFPSARWQAVGGVFRRWERDVIDWVRPNPSAVWRTANLRTVSVTGLEAGARWRADGRGTIAVDYAWIHTAADPLAALSKYTLDYPKQSVILSGSGRLPGGIEAGVRVESRQRVGRSAYALADVRFSRAAGPARVFVEVTNVSGAVYQEVRGVSMPGRWVTAGVAFGGGPR